MRYIVDTTEFQTEEPTIVTLGKSDRRHRGHQRPLLIMQGLKSNLGCPTAIFIFDILPLSMMNGQPQTMITTNLERRVSMEKMGMDYLVEYPFSEETCRMKPEDFVKDILAGRMQTKVTVVDPGCSSGYKGAGNAQFSKQLEGTLGYRLYVIEKEKDHLRGISSAYVRKELEKGNVEKTNALLGEPYAIHGEVVHGNHIGTGILGFPTANLLPPSTKWLPRFGVHVSRVLADGTYHRGVTNIGRKPTVEGRNPVGVGICIFDMHQDLYGKVIEVQLLASDRPEQKFSSLEELRQRIEMDKVFAVDYLERYPETQVKRQIKRQKIDVKLPVYNQFGLCHTEPV